MRGSQHEGMEGSVLAGKLFEETGETRRPLKGDVYLYNGNPQTALCDHDDQGDESYPILHEVTA